MPNRFAWNGICSRQLAVAIGAGAVVLALGGCAVSYTDDRGVQHTIELVDIATGPAPPNTNLAGNIVDIRAMGVSVLSVDGRTGVSIGYQRITSAAMRDNAFAAGPFDHVEAVPVNRGLVTTNTGGTE